MQIPPTRKTNGKWPRNNEQAQRFAEHLELGNQEENEMITEDIVQENEDTKLVTATEVKNEINNTDPKKAPGFDPITGVTALRFKS